MDVTAACPVDVTAACAVDIVALRHEAQMYGARELRGLVASCEAARSVRRATWVAVDRMMSER